MFNDKSQSNNQTSPDPADLNTGKDFPFKKINDSQTTPLQDPSADSTSSGQASSGQEKRLSGMKGPVEDILAETESGQEPVKPIESEKTEVDEKIEPSLKEIPRVPAMTQPLGRGRPAMDQPRIKSIASAAEPMPQTESKISTPPVMSEVSVAGQKNKIFMILIIIFIIIILGLASVFAYQYFTKSSKTESDLEPSGNLEELLDILDENANTVPTGTNNANVQNQEIEEDEDLKYYTDTDSDGLTDKQEFDLGTNINKFDTDDDGLSDFEEVEIYNSDPINPDTDNDTYLDGDEVEHGYDPLRPGNARL